jgi:hypothetical protein
MAKRSHRFSPFIGIGLLGFLGVSACTDGLQSPLASPELTPPTLPSLNINSVCPDGVEVTLIASQTIDAGKVVVSNDDDELTVTFCTSGDWLLAKTDVHVADGPNGIPQNRGGFIPGQFDQNVTHAPEYRAVYTHIFDLGDWEPGDVLAIAAHADLVKLDGYGAVTETAGAWGDGTNVGRNWSTYFTYEVQASNLLYDGGFDLTCNTAGQWFNPTSAAITTAPANWYAWRAFRSWACALEADNWYAAQDPSLHDPPSDNLTQAIKQAIDGSVVPSGSDLRLSFDYRSANRTVHIQVWGLTGSQTWQPHPVGGAPLGTCSGCTLLLDQTFPASANWTGAVSNVIPVGSDFAAIAVGLLTGGPNQTPFRGIDNVVLTFD